ncbi:dipicolinate synthase subunit A [Oceanobacillus iheyensis HTE831]|uniref:Dipicolinate synthase subunit A n=1 Tax=Oceanobacillus iheyensis (strain DSM 14371 / CIP 107618 / JCM 11309 / KCTC 3954 / HTE831) TaxID=221109 RepID=Q8EQT3_OCEIH|nr:dipicolinic acid synthetase subunit A [Oceanobacillus iheyensis]BAC13564.1 dipicolinate synthase subunit A [Oceanobacillus iheyensis HTE831]
MNRLIAVIGGDARYLELIKQLKNVPNNKLLLCGFDKLEQGFTGLNELELDELDPSTLDVVILPITGTDQHGKVETVFTDKEISLGPDWFQQLKKSCVVFTGITNDYLTEQTKNAGVTLISLLERDDVAIYNSIPTAEGAIMMAFEQTDQTIHSSRVMVVGFGRVGNTVANKFSALGAKVSVCARSIRDLARITEMGLHAIPLNKMSEYTAECDILINTIPALVVTKESIQHLPTNAVIIDLASKPGGTDFTYAKRRGINAILARSLPGIVAPRTAGKILADVVNQILDEERSES